MTSTVQANDYCGQVRPNLCLPRAYQWYAQFFSYRSQYRAAIPLIERARELDPLSPLILTESGWPYFYLGEFERATERFEASLAVDPGFALAHLNVGNVHEASGRHHAAIQAYRTAAASAGGAPLMVAFLAASLARTGQRDEAQRLLEQLLEPARRGAPLGLYVALVYEALGERELALDWLERSAESRETLLPALAIPTWLRFSSLRSEPRFVAVAESWKAWTRLPQAVPASG